MKHKILKFLLVTLILASAIAGVLFYAIYVSPDKLNVVHENIESTKIPASLDGVNIAYISDLHYGEFMDEKRLTSMLDKVNSAAPDVVLFGGDLFTDPNAYIGNAEEVEKITNLLASIQAPLGKFFVLGDCDLLNPESKELVSTIMYRAGYEDLTNKNNKIHNGTSESVTLIGIDSRINGTPSIQDAYANISNTSFNIAFTHAPDTFIDIPKENTDLALAGHSHGGQISLPIYGPLSSTPGAQKYESGIHVYDNLTIAISNGLGTTGVDMRLFSPPEVIIYRLHNK